MENRGGQGSGKVKGFFIVNEICSEGQQKELNITLERNTHIRRSGDRTIPSLLTNKSILTVGKVKKPTQFAVYVVEGTNHKRGKTSPIILVTKKGNSNNGKKRFNGAGVTGKT